MLKLEIAETPLALANGLMFRKKLDENSGMLFKFPNTSYASFWGKNTYLPLDVAFISPNNTITEIRQITPMSTKIIRSKDLCSMAVETNAGFFKKHGIQPGHKINIQDNIEIEASFSVEN